jgi:hypothetical protein
VFNLTNPSLVDVKIIRNIKRDLVLKRREIEHLANTEQKKKALKAYADLLTSLEMKTLALS